MSRKRHLSPAASAAALDAASTCRKAAIQLLTEAPISSDAYREAASLVTAIDRLALALTGNEAHFHSRSHPVG